MSYSLVIDSGCEGYHKSRKCSKATYSESSITKYTGIQRMTVAETVGLPALLQAAHPNPAAARQYNTLKEF